MTAEIDQNKIVPFELEAQLLATSLPLVRIDLIDRLLPYLVYTQPKAARQLLDEQALLLQQYSMPDQHLGFFQHLAALDNLSFNFSDAETSLRKALELVEEYGNIQQRIDTLIDYVGTLFNLNRNDDARTVLERAERLLKTFPSDHLAARIFCRRGFIDLKEGNYTRALQKFLEAFNILGGNSREFSLKDHYFYTLINSGLGNVYEVTGEFDKADNAYRRTIDRCLKYGMHGRLAWYYLNLGNVYLSMGDYAEAEKYLMLVINNEDEGSSPARASAYANLGSCLIEQNEYRKAEDLFDRAERFFRSSDRDYWSNLITITFWRARIKQEEGDLKGCIKQLEKSLQLAEKHGGVVEHSEIYLILAQSYARVNDYKSAYLAQVKYDEYQQRHQEIVNHRRMRELETQYQTAAKEKEAERLKLKSSQLQLNALRAQMNPHFLYNSLNSIQSFITTNDINTASKYLAKFAMLMRQSLEYTNKEFISLEDEIVFLTDYLEISCHLRFEGKLIYRIKVDEEIEEDILGVPTMIIQPYVENAIEHGLRGRQNGKIDIVFEQLDDVSIRATITDNGIGRRKVQAIQANDMTRIKHRSRGTEITINRLCLLQPELKREDAVKIIDLYDDNGVAKGTRVEVIIPVNDLQLV